MKSGSRVDLPPPSNIVPRKRPAAAAAVDPRPVFYKVVRRLNPADRAEAYILRHGHYFVALKAKRCANCQAIISTLATELQQGVVGGTAESARARLEELVESKGEP